MFGLTLRAAWIALVLGSALAAPASADGPGAGFKLEAEGTFISPDRTIRVEQYAKAQEDENLLYQFWTFDRNHAQAVKSPGRSK